MTEKVTALILAGKPLGAPDPLAERAGMNQKCGVPVDGKPMIEKVVDGASASELVGLTRFYFGWGSKEELFASISGKFGHNPVPIVLSNREFAMDVDAHRSFGITKNVLAHRAAAA